MWFCKHEWKVLSEITTKSRAEYAMDIGFKEMKVNGYGLLRKHIQVFTCNKCGKLKRFVEEI